MRGSCPCEKGRDLERQQRGDREIAIHGKSLVCQLGEAWDHCPVLLCTIIPLNPALLLSLPPITPTPPPPNTHTHTHTPTHAHTPTHPHTHTHTLHTHLTVLFIDDSSLPFLSGYTVNTGALAPRGPNGLISTVYSCALSRMTHKGTKRPLCAGKLFLSLSTGPTDARCTLFFESPPVSSSLTGLSSSLRASCLPVHPGLTVPVSHPFIHRKLFTCHVSPLRPTLPITFFLRCVSVYPFILYSRCFPSASDSSPNGL